MHLDRALYRTTDIAWLAAFRALYGLAMCVSMLRLIGYGWLDQLFVEPSFHFKYWGFEWVEPLSSSGMHALAWCLAALALAVSLGFCFRIAAFGFVAGFTYLQLIDVTTYLNHYYLASLLGLLLAVSPAHRAASVDAVLWPTGRRTSIPVAWSYLFRFQVAVVYTFAGVAKAHGDWLLQGMPLRIWLGSDTDLPLLGPLFTLEWTPLLMSWAGFLYDSTIAIWLSWSKTRRYAFATVIVFHALTGLLFPIGMFPVIMVLSALVFFSPDWPRRLLERARALIGRAPASEGTPGEPHLVLPRRTLRRLVVAAGVSYCALQLLVPLRFLVYGGNVRWHEQGMRFSWRVMVREKNGSITYVVRHKQTGRIWHVAPHRYLTALQEREMSGQPDLILQLAHHIQRDFEASGRGPVEVRVDALVSLNGRGSVRLIDPRVDLASVEDGLQKAFWILPAPNTAPPRIRPI